MLLSVIGFLCREVSIRISLLMMAAVQHSRGIVCATDGHINNPNPGRSYPQSGGGAECNT